MFFLFVFAPSYDKHQSLHLFVPCKGSSFNGTQNKFYGSNSSDPMSFQVGHGHQRFQKQMASVTMFRMAVVRNEETADTPTATNVEREKSHFEKEIHLNHTFILRLHSLWSFINFN